MSPRKRDYYRAQLDAARLSHEELTRRIEQRIAASLGSPIASGAQIPSRPEFAAATELPWDKQIGAVYGYRRFKVDNYSRIRPWAPIDYIWTPGENVARCQAPRYDLSLRLMSSTYRLGSETNENRHRAPAPGCNCGFYARSVFDQAVIDDVWDEPNAVLGVIEGYGRTEIGTKGFRSEKAVIRELWIPGRKAAMGERLVALYPDVEVHTTKAALFNKHPEFGMPERGDDLPADFWTRP